MSSKMETRSETKYTLELVGKIKLSLLLKSALVGGVGGLIICSFRYLLSQSETLVRTLYYFVREHLIWLPVLLLAYLGIGMVVGLIVKTEPMIKGSGIPQVEGQLIGAFHINWLPALLKKYIGGLLSIGSGLFLGREGPSIQLNALVGQGVADLLHSPDYEKSVSMSAEEVKEKLSAGIDGTDFSGDPSGWITVVSRTESETVNEVTVGGVSTTGKQVRSLLGLRSADFSV